MKLPMTLLAAAILLSACASTPMATRRHPAYMQAFSKLRAARWILKHSSGGYAAGKDEFGALWQVKAAMNSVRQAAVDEGQDPYSFPLSDPPFGYGRGLQRTLGLLSGALGYLDQEEDRRSALFLRNSSIRHVKQAMRLVQQALSE